MLTIPFINLPWSRLLICENSIWISWIETEKKATSLENDLFLLFLNPEPTFSRIILLGKFKVNFWELRFKRMFFYLLVAIKPGSRSKSEVNYRSLGKCVVWLFWGSAGGARGAVGGGSNCPPSYSCIPVNKEGKKTP